MHYICCAACVHVSNTSAVPGPIRNSYWTRRRRTKKIIESWKSVTPAANCSMIDAPPSCSSSPTKTPNCSSYCDDIQDNRINVMTSEERFLEMSSVPATSNEFNSSDYENVSACYSDIHDCNALDCFPDNFSSDSSDSDEINLVKELADWVTEFGVSSVAVDKLLKILRSTHTQLPLTCRTLLQTGKCNDTIVSISGGEYMHYGILKGLLSCQHFFELGQRNIQYQVNIDGLPLYKSSSTQLWPILGKVVGIESGPFLIGAYCGSSKPKNIDEFLKAFVMEAKALAEDGFEINGCKFVASIACFICDAPARAFLKQIKGHTGYDGCERCVQKGFHVESRMTYPLIDAEKRTDEVFSLMGYESHQLDASPLLTLQVGLVSGFVLDSMHLVYLGVTRRLLHMWTKGPRPTKLSHLQVDIISEKLSALQPHVPSEFARKPRSLHDMDRWKATEFRQFVLYTGIVALKSELDEALYNNFLCLSVAVFMLSNCNLLNHYVDYAEELLAYFVEESANLYGHAFAVYNVHSLIHIVDDARKFGCLESISSFPFENFLGRLKKTVRKPQFILQQISNRLSEGYFKPTTCTKSTVVLKKEHTSGPVVIGMMNLKRYKEVYLTGYVLKINSGDNCIGYGSNKHIGLVQNIFSDGTQTYLLVKRFKKLEAAFQEPLLSTDIDIHILSELSKSYEVCQLDDVKRKYVLLPLKDGDERMCIPLLHMD
jgi:hypothetical protein